MNRWLPSLLLVLGLAATDLALASPVGLWKTIDEATGEAGFAAVTRAVREAP